MKKGIFLLTGFLLVFLLAGIASATPYEFNDWVTSFYGQDKYEIVEGQPLTYNHDLTDDVNFAAGDRVLDATLTLDFDDDYYDGDIWIQTGWGWGNGYWMPTEEHLYYAFDGSGWSYYDEVDNSLYDIVVDVDLLNSDGILSVALSVYNGGRGNGDAVLDWSRLSGTAAPVPEPGTIVLMGLGLVGLAGMGRKKLFRK